MAVFRRAALPSQRPYNPTLVPSVPVEVDWSHPLSRGLIIASLGQQPGVNLARVLPFMNPGNLNVLAGPSGIGVVSFGAAAANYGQFDISLLPASDYSMFSKQAVVGGGTWTGAPMDADNFVNVRICQCSNNGNPTNPAYIPFDTAGNPYFVTSSVTLTAAQQAQGWTQSCRLALAQAIGFQTINGTPSGSVAVSNTPQVFNNGGSNPRIAIGGAIQGPAVFNGPVYVALVWNRKLSDAEDAWIHAAPFIVFRPIVRRFVMAPPGVAPTGKLFLPPPMTGLGSGGPFFSDRLT